MSVSSKAGLDGFGDFLKEMASGGSVPSKDHFMCSICLEKFSLPVTLPCGHNFCKGCITGYWDSCHDYTCPLCVKRFPRSVKDTLQVNTVLRDVIDSLRSDVKASMKPFVPESGEIVCDVCDVTTNQETKKAVRSCWQCLASFCPAHLELHSRLPGLQRHRLVEPVHSLEQRVCRVHGELLDSYCHTHATWACPRCLLTGHGKACAAVSLETECDERRAVQDVEETDVGEAIEERTVELRSFLREVEEHVSHVNERFTNEEMTSDPVVAAHTKAMNTLESWVWVGIRTLEEEDSKEKMRRKELKKLWKNKDYFLLLKTFLSGNSLSSVMERVEGIGKALEEQRVTFHTEVSVFREHEQHLRKLKEQRRCVAMDFLFLFVCYPIGSV